MHMKCSQIHNRYLPSHRTIHKYNCSYTLLSPVVNMVTVETLPLYIRYAVCTIFGNSPMSRAIIAVATALIPDMGIAVTFHITLELFILYSDDLLLQHTYSLL